MKLVVIIAAILSMAGCSTFKPIPENYTGPTATIKDSYATKQSNKAHYFTLNGVDGNYISNSFGATRSANSGRGAAFDPVMSERQVLTKQQTFTIAGFVFFPTDAQLLFGDTLKVSGDIFFAPKEGETYVVKGTVSEALSVVWLEDSEGNLVKEKISKTHNR